MQCPFGGYATPVPPYPYPDVHYSGYGPPPPARVPHLYPPAPYPYPVYGVVEAETAWKYVHPHPPQVEYYLPSLPRTPVYPPLMPPMGAPSVNQPPRMPAEDVVSEVVSAPSDGLEVPHGAHRPPGAKNILDIVAIENGMDTRTTVMIKNIPNKMTDADLKMFIDRVCPRRIDFMYLRMDFQNGASIPLCCWIRCSILTLDFLRLRRIGCNVGYAFVNFITVQDLLRFAKSQIGVKWFVEFVPLV